ncbi:MAG: tetratricopeptide repeat protein [Oscillatoriales cyanobacterium]|uniref:tetratricopeptide repeat protein n=1 Tax=unclassified Microcoleus TaxID=2642155 RepID=UPI001DBABDE5|nr:MULTISPECIES: tetratricopeptide repeat protein [unclassified Microcoleus]TAE83429.1 MAG: tetratricopeptide repeat protein [Oscillatoriales cyanobacterium]TAF23552.1 MAG: tetratricopeptide repeat protein [Oscillatoriales cyanobacterium]TAF57851.1 MAG: tetratricopeptide repeat protein [Oscillatoriales cyanobacterium]
MSNLNSQNQDNYDDLLVSIEAGKDILNLLIAVCDDSDCRDRIISDYEAELEPDIRRYRVELARGEPSLRSAIANLVAQEPYLQQGGKAVITVTGVEKLRFFKQFGESRSEQEVFFGYLQWTREALRDFPFSIVLWVTRQIEVLISNESPDFWSWRKGVFRFDTKKTAAITKEEFEPLRLLVEDDRELPSLIPLEDLPDLIARTEQEKGLQDPCLASIYVSMGKIHNRRIEFGECQNFQKEYELTIDYFKKAISLQQDLDMEAELSVSLSYLAKFYKSQGRYSEAEPLFLQALQVDRLALPEDHPRLGDRLTTLARFYEFQGRYLEAEKLYLEALEIDRRSLPQYDFSLAIALNNLAGLYRSQGRYSEAELLYLQAVEIDKRALGEDHPSLATRLNNLALVYKSQGRYSEAERLYLQALKIGRRSLLEDHASWAIAINNLAGLYRSQGRYSEAESLYLEALEIHRRSLLPEDNPRLATGLNNLAFLYKSQGRYSEAEPLYLQALEIHRLSLPKDHPSLAIDLNNLAELYKSQGRYSEAEPLYLQAVKILRSKLPENHPNLLLCWKNYVGLWRKGISKGIFTFEQLQKHPFGEQLLAEIQE